MAHHPISRYRAYVVASEDASMLVSSDARAIGAVTSRTTSMKRDPRTRGIGGTVFSIAPDGTRTVFSAPRSRSYARKVRKVTVKHDNAGTYADRLARFGAVGVGE